MVDLCSNCTFLLDFFLSSSLLPSFGYQPGINGADTGFTSREPSQVEMEFPPRYIWATPIDSRDS